MEIDYLKKRLKSLQAEEDALPSNERTWESMEKRLLVKAKIAVFEEILVYERKEEEHRIEVLRFRGPG